MIKIKKAPNSLFNFFKIFIIVLFFDFIIRLHYHYCGFKDISNFSLVKNLAIATLVTFLCYILAYTLSITSKCYLLIQSVFANAFNKLHFKFKKQYLIFLLSIFSGVACGTSWLYPSTYTCAILSILSALFFILLAKSTTKIFPFFLSGCILNSIGFYWLYDTIHDFGRFSVFISSLIFIGFVLLSSLQFIAFILVYRVLKKSKILNDLYLSITSSFILVESFFPKIFPWRFGHTQFSIKSLALLSQLAGVMLISFLLFWILEIIVNEISKYISFNKEILKIKEEKKDYIKKIKYDETIKCDNTLIDKKMVWLQNIPLVKFSVILCFIGFGFHYQGILKEKTKDLPSTKVSVVQAKPTTKVLETMRIIVSDIEEYKNMTQSIVDRENSSLIIWPECALPSWIYEETKNVSENDNIPFYGDNFPLLTGFFGYKSETETYNALTLIGKKGEIKDIYNKQILIMFGEYVPFADEFPFIKKITGIKDYFSKGKETKVFSYKDINENEVKICPLICYEEVVPELFLEGTNKGANLLTGLSNDGWFGSGVALFQHNLIASFRAIENNKYFIRSTHSGLSTVLNNFGDSINSLKVNATDSMTLDVPLINGQTLYAKIKDIPLYLLDIFLIFIFLMKFFQNDEKKDVK